MTRPRRSSLGTRAQTTVLFGHAEAEQALLDAYRGGRLPHAWLIGGPPGIGKATLAYRMARFVLAHPDPQAPPVHKATSLDVGAEHPVARRIAAQAQGDLLVLERTINEKTGKLRQDIQVDDVRRTVSFFGSTAGEGGWRIAIVDAVDELNPAGANALLKVLEEPPRARPAAAGEPFDRRACCRRSARVAGCWRCARFAPDDVARAAAAAHRRAAPTSPTSAAAAAVADGSVRPRAGAARWRCARACASGSWHCSSACPRSIRAHCTRSATRSPAPIRRRSPLSSTRVNAWLVGAARRRARRTAARLARLARGLGEGQRRRARRRDYNLERKPLVFNVFGWLAEAARG